ncbi:MAG: restriction endonuclease subunit S [Candidatus Riflebacteria bacterium]|nr:restriction endonuclease subunit S [Candidatus Riflebacteria bacterium]
MVNECSRNLLLSDKSIRISIFHARTARLIDIHNKSSHGIKYFDALGTQKSTSMNNVTREDLLRMPLPLPSMVEQKLIVERVTRLLSIVSDLEAQIADRKEKSNDLMQAVLREAFEGRDNEFRRVIA